MISISRPGRCAVARVVSSSICWSDKYLLHLVRCDVSAPTVRVQMLAALPADGADPIGRQLLQTHRGSAYHNWCSVRRQTDACRNAVPVAADQRVAARMTMGGLTGRIMNIAGIDIAKACIRGDPPRRAQRLRWCRWMIHQLPVRMKGREMQR